MQTSIGSPRGWNPVSSYGTDPTSHSEGDHTPITMGNGMPSVQSHGERQRRCAEILAAASVKFIQCYYYSREVKSAEEPLQKFTLETKLLQGRNKGAGARLKMRR